MLWIFGIRCRCRCRRCSPPSSPPPSLPPLRPHVSLGDGARMRVHNCNKIGQGGGSILSGDGKKVNNHGIVCFVMNNFYVKINSRQKSGNAVACTSVAPMRLHHLICHKGINAWRIIAQQRKNGGGCYYIIGIWAQLVDVSHFGDYF